MDKKLEITKATIVSALASSAPLTMAELINEVKQQGYMSKFAYALSNLQLNGVIWIADDDAIELES